MTQADDGADRPDPLLAAAAKLRSHAAFPDAVHEYVRVLAAMRAGPWLLGRITAQRDRVLFIVFLLYLDADRELWPGGANYGRLRELCMRRKQIGPRVLKTMLAIMTMAGVITVEKDPADRRLKYYRPTERMQKDFKYYRPTERMQKDFIQQWVAAIATAMDRMQPQARRAQRLAEDPAFVRHFLIFAGRALSTEAPPSARLPEFFTFFGVREGASALTIALILAELEETPLPSRSQLASRHGLSKTQVSNLIAEGSRRGFFALDDKGGLAATPFLHDHFRRWVSLALAFYGPHMS